MSLNIKLKLFTNLIRISSKDLECEPGTTVRYIMNLININPKEIVFINDIIKQIDSKLHDVDRIVFFLPIGGGQ